jgi:hypothetical protein
VCLAAALPVRGLADSQVVLDLSLIYPPTTATLRVPAPGAYTLSVATNLARVACPDGTILIIDFAKKTVSTLDPSAKTVYRLGLNDYLSFGERLPGAMESRYAAQTRVTFEPAVGQDVRSIMNQAATPYNLNLQATVARNLLTTPTRPGEGGVRGGGSSPGGGDQSGTYPGDPSSSANAGTVLQSQGCQFAGELWMSDFTPGDCDRAQLAIAETCAVMRGAPGLRALTDRIKRSKLTMLAADFSVSVLDDEGQPPTKPPVVSIETRTIDPGRFDLSIFAIPVGYKKIAAPAPPLGSAD